MASKAFVKWLSNQIQVKDGGVAADTAKATGIHFSTISRWLCNKKIEPSPRNVEKLAAHFGVEKRYVFELLGWVEQYDYQELNREEIEWLRFYRSLTPVERSKFRLIVEAIGSGPVSEPPEELQEHQDSFIRGE